MPDFEFDRRKSASNRRKHGIDFVEAQVLWDEPLAKPHTGQYFGSLTHCFIAA